jgi:hypothetical protein
MLTEKRVYLNHCMRADKDFLLACLRDPGPFMRPIHLLLIRLALRKRGITC